MIEHPAPVEGDQPTSASYLPPLDGIRVVDFTQVAAGPYASSLLGDLGADVVTVEPPGGESFRRLDDAFGPGVSGYYFGINRSKRSITVDLHDSGARPIVERLARSADICMVGFRPGVPKRLGIDYETLSAINPRLIYLSITAFGETGPRAGEPGMDILAQAMSGMMDLTGEPDGPPVKVGPPIADFTVSFLAGFAICAALRARDRDGIGQMIGLNLVDGQLASLANFITPYLRTGKPIQRVGAAHPQIVPYQAFQTADGPMIVACLSDRFWLRLCDIVDHADWATDPRFATNPNRVKHRQELTRMLQDIFVTDVRSAWLVKLRESGVPCSEINTLAEALADEQVHENSMVTELLHPKYGPYEVVNNPMHFSRTPAVVDVCARDAGQDTDDVLADLGFDSVQIGSLRQSGIVGR